MDNQSVPPKSNYAPAIMLSLAVLIAAAFIGLTNMNMLKTYTDKADKQLALQQKTYDQGNKSSTYQQDVKADEYQAVFLAGGQAYFGKITKIDDSYLTLTDIYYLRGGQDVQSKTSTSAATDTSLVKLGNETHGPEDKMTIRVSEIVFWENLKADGQISKAIAAFQKSN